MIITDNKSGSSETQSQTSSPQPSAQINPSEPTSPATVPYVPTLDNHDPFQASAGQPPPHYSPSVGSHETGPRMFITNGRPASTVDLPDSSAAGTSHTTGKAYLPEYNEAIEMEVSIQNDGRIQATFAPPQGFMVGFVPPRYEPPLQEDVFLSTPALNINIMIVGNREDVQPYITLGQRLQEYGHTVRISTHEAFRSLVKNAGLIFFNIGGDPAELTGHIGNPNSASSSGVGSLKDKNIKKSQDDFAEILDRCLLSCYADDEGSEAEPGFAADLIISNPPTCAHIHCAEALGIPLHLSYTMPWSPTASFPHPLVNIKQNEETEPEMANYYSYSLVDTMNWQSLGRVINKFRSKRLGLEQLSAQAAAQITERASVPWTYCISPTFIPKPADWMSNIDVAGFCFSNPPKGYESPSDLVEFIQAGEPPVYIGFGSVVLENSENMTKSILGAVSQAGIRAIISVRLGGLNEEMIRIAGDDVFPLATDVPHEWLFERVSAVVHHGEAGTTAVGLKCGKPMVMIPLFGDQPWWAVQVTRRGLGPPPIHPNKLSAESLATTIRMVLSPEMQESAKQVGERIRSEDGPRNAVESIHKHLPVSNMRCDLDSNRVAVWYSPTHKLRLSAFAAQVLAEAGEIDINKLELHRSREYDTRIGPIDPVSGTILPGIKVLNDLGRGAAALPSRPGKGATKMLSAATLGLQNTLQGAAEGMHNLPRVYGGEVRKHKKVTGIGSGFVQGGKEFALGLYDGFSDFFMEPVRGFKRGGVVGAIGGVGIGALNLTTKPTAGFMQAVSMPIEGTVKEVKALIHREVGKDRVVTRYAQGVSAARNASEAEREKVVRRFVECVGDQNSTSTTDRKGKGKSKMDWKS